MLATLRKRIADVFAPAPAPVVLTRRVTLAELEAEVEAEPLKTGVIPAGTDERIAISGQAINAGLSDEEPDSGMPELKARETRMPAFDALRRGDPYVASQLMALKLPILSGEFTVEPGESLPELPSAAAARKVAETVERGDEGVTPPGAEPTTDKPKPDAKPPKSIALAEPADGADDADPMGDAEADAAADLAAQDAQAQAVMLVEANLFGRHAPEYRMRQSWSKFMREALLKLDFGGSFFERTYRWQEGALGKRIVVDGLYWIKPLSITEFHVDRNDQLIGIRQKATGTAWVEQPDGTQVEQKIDVDRDIPADNLVYFLHDAEGADHEGISVIRRFYAAAKRRGFLARLRVVDAQRRGAPMPVADIPDNASRENKAAVLQTLRRMAAGGQNETQFALNTGGVKFSFLEVGSNVPDLTEMMESEELSIAGVNGLRFQMLGTAGEGSRAVAQTLADYFNLNLKSIAADIEEGIQRQMVEPLHVLNFGAPQVDAAVDAALAEAGIPADESDDDAEDGSDISSTPAPRFRISGVTPTDLDSLAEAKNKGLVTWSDEDEQEYRRKRGWRLLSDEELTARARKKAEGEALARMAAESMSGASAEDHGAPPPQMAPPKPPAELSEKSDAKAQRKLMRALRLARIKRHLPLDDIEKRREEARREFVHLVGPLRQAAIDEALSKAVITGTRVEIPRLKSKPLADAMRAFAAKYREFGRETARMEIRSKVAALTTPNAADLAETPPPFDPFKPAKPKRGLIGVAQVADAFSEELETVIGLNVDEMLTGVSNGLKREMFSQLAQDVPDADAIAAARRALLDYSEAPIERWGDQIASRAIAGGRADVTEQAREALADSDEGIVLEYAERVHVGEDDPCDPCQRLDGTLVQIGSPQYFEIMPPAKCDGGEYCHCQYDLDVTAERVDDRLRHQRLRIEQNTERGIGEWPDGYAGNRTDGT